MYKRPQFYQPPLAFGHLPLSGEKIPSLIGEGDHEVVERLLPDRELPRSIAGVRGCYKYTPLNPPYQGNFPIYFPSPDKGRLGGVCLIDFRQKYKLFLYLLFLQFLIYITYHLFYKTKCFITLIENFTDTKIKSSSKMNFLE